MWLLECDDDLFDHKKRWLRPGTALLLGRASSSGQDKEKSPSDRKINIKDKSVSRQHLVISVSPVKDGNGSKTHVKSELKLTDDSKKGTLLDDHRFTNDTKILDGTQHVFYLGNDRRKYTILWRPVVFTLSMSDKQVRSGKDLLAPYLERLEQLDIKVILSFVFDSTTHVVAAKRNLPKVLHALVTARYIVTDAFIDAIVNASASPGVEEDGQTQLPSDLETDFEGSWPDPTRYLPAPGREPNPRSPQYFQPTKSRGSVFDGFTFVFADKSQHESLAEPVAAGGAKCPLFNLSLMKTSARDLADYVRNFAGKKGFDPGSAKGIVMVRFRSKQPEASDWVIQLIQDLDLELGQRSVEQNEFLDAILANDASPLKRPLEEDVDEASIGDAPSRPNQRRAATDQPAERQGSERVASANLSEQQAENSGVSADHDRVDTSQKSARSDWRTRRAQARFKGFDDDDEDAIQSVPRSRTGAQKGSGQSSAAMGVDEQGLFVENESEPGGKGRTSSLKRPAPSAEEAMDKLFPASRAMKRRRVAQEASAKGSADTITLDDDDDDQEDAAPIKTSPDSKKDKRDVVNLPKGELRNAVQAHAREMDEKHRDIDTPEAEDGYAGEDISNLRNLAIVEEMEVPARRPVGRRTRRSTDTGGDERWKEEWNGRKNFKGFRRRGEATANRGQRVIVRVEEETNDGSGVTDEMWGDASPERSDQNGAGDEGMDSDEGTAPAAPAAKGKKRPAASTASAGPRSQAKRPRQAPSRATARRQGPLRDEDNESSSSSDEDGLKFRLRR